MLTLATALIFQSLDWDGSSQVCKSVLPGVHLAAITSAEKQKAIENRLEEQFNSKYIDRYHDLDPNFGGSQKRRACGTPYVWKTLNAVEIPFNYTSLPENPVVLATLKNALK